MSSIMEPATVVLSDYESSFTSESSPIGVECDRVCDEKKKKEKKERKSRKSSGERRSSLSKRLERHSSNSSELEKEDSEVQKEAVDIGPLRPRLSSTCRIADLPSPSALSFTRLQSPVIKTSQAVTHELHDGRVAIVVPTSGPSRSGLRRTSASGGNLTTLGSFKIDDSFNRANSDDELRQSRDYLADPHPLRLDAWCEPSGKSFQVRGPRYMTDKVKIDSSPAVFRLLTVDLVRSEKPVMTGLCSNPNERIQRALSRERLSGAKELPDFVLAINLVIPSGSLVYHAVFYFGVDDVNILKDTSSPFGKLANRFFFGESDQFRNDTFKLIPRVVEGNFMVRKAVGTKPAILGKKIKQKYIRTNRFMELIVDIASDSIANKIVTMSLGYARTLSVDMAFALQGNDPSTLPEQVMAAVRMNQIDFKRADGQRLVS